MDVTSAQSIRVRGALLRAAARLRVAVSAAAPGLRVTADWTAADTLAHLCSVAAIDIAMVTGSAPALPVPGLNDIRARTTVDTIVDMNAAVLSRFRERDTGVLLERLDRDLRRLIEAADSPEAPGSVSWLGGATLPLDGLLAHLVNEIDIHGWDIARAARTPWHTDPADAELFLDLFLVGIIRNGYGRLLDRAGPVRPGRITVTFRPRGAKAVTMSLADGVVRVEGPDPRPDVILSYAAPTFNRTLFGRVSRGRAVLTGKLRIGGRRPWLLPAFTETMRLPS